MSIQSFSAARNAVQTRDYRAFPPLTVGGVILRASEGYADEHVVSVRYRRNGSQDEIGLSIVRGEGDRATVYATGQIGNVRFGENTPGAPLSDYGLRQLQAGLEQDYQYQLRLTRDWPARQLDRFGIRLSDAGVTPAPEEGPALNADASFAAAAQLLR